ncbi:sensor histidine kinase [Flagellimonas sp. 2504JD1-5]
MGLEKYIKNRDYFRVVLILTIFYTIWKIVKYLNFLWLYYNQIPDFGEVIHPSKYLDAILLDWVVVISFMSFVAYLIQKGFDHKKIRLSLLIPIHLVLSFLIGFFIFPVLFLSYWLTGRISFEIGFFNVLLDRVIKYMDTNFLTYFSMLGVILIYYYFKGIKDQESKKAILESQLTEARVSALNSQLQPHFIFNALNGISSLIDEDSEKAQELVASLGDMLRNILNHNQAVQITLKNELDNLKNYLHILKIRFEEDLTVRIDIQKGLDNCLVPNLFLQPIVENAVKHGYGFKKKKLNLSIDIFKNQDVLVFKLWNDGLPLNGYHVISNKKGNGLRIIKQRLEAQYPESFSFKIRNLPNKRGVENVIKIPLNWCSQNNKEQNNAILYQIFNK